MKYKFLIITVATILLMSTMTGGVYAKKSAYDSGFDHGCSDAQISNPNEWYINGVNSKGESTGKDHHTAAFNAGYDAGFKECGYDNGYLITNSESNTAVDDSFNNRDSVVQPQSQGVVTNQNAGCSKMIINGDCIIGQDQDVENNLGQANRAEN